MKKIFSVLAVSFLALFALAGCDDGGSDSDTIRVGVNYGTTGPYATYGTSSVEGTKLAVKEINKNGGINGKKIELVEMDNKSDTNEAVNIATKLTTEEDVVLTLGPEVSGNTKAAISVANKNKIPLISPSATDDKVTVNKDGSVTEYGYKMCFNDSYQGKALAQYAIAQGKTKAVIYGDSSSDYSKGLTKAFEEEFKKQNGTIVASENYVEGDTDFNAALTNIKGKDFDVLFIPGYYNEAGLIIKQARTQGINQMILGADGFDSPTLIELGGTENLKDVFFTTHFSIAEENKDIDNFIAAYKDEFGKEPDAFAALGYDLGYYMADSIERAGDDITPETVNKALSDTKAKFSGITGSFSMGKDHVPVKTIKIVELQAGEPVNVVNFDVK
ncbi:branched-chain amino acid transport system substrate-binding protein [Breznakia sp. PF5-3]|uniref:ABC transporter substrate-binding protein n=1 Tax=unclassified Breznakia TaxID=2623764 RepID=UPI0024064EEE|nr:MULTISPECIES: ABC transporter substrate-binding protein [unclassified Breznakia]MDF9824584.1 branched-chain amino acid transport system substrate-binding protein [Breznakia sp. PM6-1]MDF9835474.1 branched-chain amino acid transport system substrate-binding protein [Breznakia sp. PF5-3]MDF9837884.1 branched-chain amino acid transport system substrate-binding protein [Breznakia sp. PFB2-8]MDF9859823.1 branched-chain amino acid transport system substrate-binding protein [Breznakia sp. PH5-24]